MNYSKAMIDLVMDIRRHAPRDKKPGIKLANPELLNDLMPLYRASSCTIFKTLVKELFALAGDGWITTLLKEDLRSDKIEQQSGSDSASAEQEAAAASKSQRMYRGQPLYG